MVSNKKKQKLSIKEKRGNLSQSKKISHLRFCRPEKTKRVPEILLRANRNITPECIKLSILYDTFPALPARNAKSLENCSGIRKIDLCEEKSFHFPVNPFVV